VTARHRVAVIAPHPDDEAIFCGGTIARLTAAGHQVVVIAATSGDAGLGDRRHLAKIRAAELEASAEILGVHSVHHLGFADSGLHHGVDPGVFASCDPVAASVRLAEILAHEAITDVVCDPFGGIYAHPDHAMAHDVTARAAQLAGVESLVTVTVDREHLHFVETHLVADAHAALAESAPGAPAGFGASSVEIEVVLELDSASVNQKRKAMAAHSSQLPPHSAVMTLDDDAFASVYGIEWFCHHGNPGVLGTLL
jgi:LmbE family N-acetylglucosaminyl deacetylase